MALKTTTESLEEVQAAITKVLEAQAYTIGDTSVTRAQLKILEQREERLLNRLEKENGTRPATAKAQFGNAGDHRTNGNNSGRNYGY